MFRDRGLTTNLELLPEWDTDFIVGWLEILELCGLSMRWHDSSECPAGCHRACGWVTGPVLSDRYVGRVHERRQGVVGGIAVVSRRAGV